MDLIKGPEICESCNTTFQKAPTCNCWQPENKIHSYLKEECFGFDRLGGNSDNEEDRHNSDFFFNGHQSLEVDITIKEESDFTVKLEPELDMPECIEITDPYKTINEEFPVSDHVNNTAKTWHCDLCHRGFRTKEKVVRHRRKHTGEKPYECDICGKCFSRSDKLFLHKRIHSGEKPFSCTVCLKTFSRRDKLTTHMKVHSK